MFPSRQLLLSCIFLFGLSFTGAAQQPTSDSEIEQRVNALLQKMTLEEKAGQLTQLAAMNARHEPVSPAALCRLRTCEQWPDPLDELGEPRAALDPLIVPAVEPEQMEQLLIGGWKRR